jgi:protein TonB
MGTGPVPGPAPSAESLEAVYRAEQFGYLRDRIARNLIYPPQAIKAGWTGRVRVAFVILADGTVKDVRITASSGTALLDRAVREAVLRAAPFPLPPVSARVEIPVAFSLR